MQGVEISKTDYEPSDMDILYAEGISLSNSLTSMEFSFPKLSSEDSLYPEYQHDSSLRFEQFFTQELVTSFAPTTNDF